MSSTLSVNSHTERDRLSILLAVTISSATLFRFVDLPTFSWGMREIFGSPLRFTMGGEWLLSLLMTGLVATGTLSLMRDHPLRDAPERRLIFSLIAPSLSALLVSLLLIRATLWPIWLAALLAGGILIGILVHLGYRAYSPGASGYASARTLLNILNYLIGFILYSFILEGQERALVTGPLIMGLTLLLSLDLLSASGATTGQVLLFSGILALWEGELAWALGYWPLSAWSAATILTLGLYLGSGIGYQHLLGRLTLRIALEFALVAALIFAVVMWIRP